MTNQKSIYRLTESALMIAIAAVLSVIKIVDMPVGGSVTLLSMLPIALIAYRYGTAWGLFTGFAYGLVQMLLGLENLNWVSSVGGAVVVILFDYVVAFMGLGLGGIFRKAIPHQGAALALGCILGGAWRYLCHVVTGFTVWAGITSFADITPDVLSYSFVYNGVYMLPEVVLLATGALYLSRLLNFGDTTITRAPAKTKASPLAVQLSVVSITALFAAVVADIVLILPELQTEDAVFFTEGLANVDWMTVGIITGLAVVVAAVCMTVAAKLSKSES